jgi:hypothetical protein
MVPLPVFGSGTREEGPTSEATPPPGPADVKTMVETLVQQALAAHAKLVDRRAGAETSAGETSSDESTSSDDSDAEEEISASTHAGGRRRTRFQQNTEAPSSSDVFDWFQVWVLLGDSGTVAD